MNLGGTLPQCARFKHLDFDRPVDFAATLDAIVDQADGGPLSGLVDPAVVGFMGHSGGTGSGDDGSHIDQSELHPPFDALFKPPRFECGSYVDLGLHNTNRHDTLDGPAIRVSPLQAKVADTHLSCRTAILDAIDRLHERTGTSEFARRDIVAEVQAAGGAAFERQTIYRCIRRLSGQEPGAAYRDLEELDSDRLRLRFDWR